MTYNRDWDAYNREVVAHFRATGGEGKVEGKIYPVILLITRGAKSGLPRTTPLMYTRDGDRIIVIASKGGSPTHPDWYHNLVANPEVTVELGTERFQARASVAEGEERRRLFDQQAALMPFFARYEETTPRQIPVIILERLNKDR